MSKIRSAWLTFIAVAGHHCTHAAGAFPDKPVRYVVGGSVGGGADVLARTIAQKLGERDRKSTRLNSSH